jgi:hypothetical protein
MADNDTLTATVVQEKPIETDDPLSLFLYALWAPETKRQYPRRLEVFLDYLSLHYQKYIAIHQLVLLPQLVMRKYFVAADFFHFPCKFHR